MIKLIVGHKGSGKTKMLVDMVSSAVKLSKGHVVCVEKNPKLTYDVDHAVRLLETDSYGVSGYDAFHGFLAGIAAGDYDVTDILVDATLRIGSRDYDELGTFLDKVNALSEKENISFVFTISADADELPESVTKYL